MVNKTLTSIQLDNVIVDREQTTQIELGSKLHNIHKLISEYLRAIKKKNMDMDGKKQINSKEEQKNILGGHSLDFGDAASLITLFDLVKQPEPNLR